MTTTILGLSSRWQRSFDERARSALAPCRLGGLCVARAGRFVVGVDAATGTLAWQQRVLEPETIDGFILARCGDVVVTDWRDRATRNYHLQAVDASGTRRWDIELASGTGAGAISVDPRTLATTTLGETWQLVTVDEAGVTTRMRLPHPSGALAPLGDGAWLFGNSGMARNHPALYLLRGDAVTPIAAAKQVFYILPSTLGPLTYERDGEKRAIVARDHHATPRWRADLVTDNVATAGALVFGFTGDVDRPVPTAFDLTTGDVRWRAAALPYPAVAFSASGDLVLATHEEGAVLLSASGAFLGEHDGRVGAIDVADGTACLYVDDALVGLALP